jgi:hypothetical protein
MAGSSINQEVMRLAVHLKCENIATMALCFLMTIIKSKNKICKGEKTHRLATNRKVLRKLISDICNKATSIYFSLISLQFYLLQDNISVKGKQLNRPKIVRDIYKPKNRKWNTY